MSRKIVGLVVAVAFVALLSPPLERALVATMPRLLLAEVPALLALGLIAGSLRRSGPLRFDPNGLASLAFFAGALGFWMIPRAVDAVALGTIAATAMRVSLFSAGAFLGVGLRVMPFVARGALAVYSVAMVFALGLIYSNYRALLCSSFTLSDQLMVGKTLLYLTPVALVTGITLTARSLRRELPHSKTHGRVELRGAETARARSR
ncbi:MAG: hypothetical protein OZ921_06165 [Sorangiineae bacterium]|nr:hypothetical protein [Polyangiaceae bacterium]MEB2322078.1 hypothetical protein [Sorangiineae bacterium]